jgi:hypothetical protein
MRTSVISAALAFGLALGFTALPEPFGNAAQAGTTAAKPKKPDMQRVAQHLKEHVKYPATRQQILDACAQTKEFSAAEKAWTGAHLPDGTYASAEDVLKALGNFRPPPRDTCARPSRPTGPG